MDTRKFDIKHSAKQAVRPYSVETRPTENWTIRAVYDTYHEAHGHIARIMTEYPRLPVRLTIYRKAEQ